MLCYVPEKLTRAAPSCAGGQGVCPQVLHYKLLFWLLVILTGLDTMGCMLHCSPRSARGNGQLVDKEAGYRASGATLSWASSGQWELKAHTPAVTDPPLRTPQKKTEKKRQKKKKM